MKRQRQKQHPEVLILMLGVAVFAAMVLLSQFEVQERFFGRPHETPYEAEGTDDEHHVTTGIYISRDGVVHDGHAEARARALAGESWQSTVQSPAQVTTQVPSQSPAQSTGEAGVGSGVGSDVAPGQIPAGGTTNPDKGVAIGIPVGEWGIAVQLPPGVAPNSPGAGVPSATRTPLSNAAPGGSATTPVNLAQAGSFSHESSGSSSRPSVNPSSNQTPDNARNPSIALALHGANAPYEAHTPGRGSSGAGGDMAEAPVADFKHKSASEIYQDLRKLEEAKQAQALAKQTEALAKQKEAQNDQNEAIRMAARVAAAKKAAEKEAADKEAAAKLQAAKDLAAREKAASEKAAQEQAAKLQAAKEQAAKDQAAKDQAAKELAAREKAAKEQAAKDQATKDQAARELAAVPGGGGLRNTLPGSKFVNLAQSRGVSVPLGDDAVSSTVTRFYGATFVADPKLKLPARAMFEKPSDSRAYQKTIPIKRFYMGGYKVSLQAPAADALIAAQKEASAAHLKITPVGDVASLRSYEDTSYIWHKYLEKGLGYWVGRKKLTAAQAQSILSSPPKKQLSQVIALEQKGLYLHANHAHSILNLAAPPGSSQHISGLALDIEEHQNANVRNILNRHGWYQTVAHDFPHFIYLGRPINELPQLGLTSIKSDGRQFWVPDVPDNMAPAQVH